MSAKKQSLKKTGNKTAWQSPELNLVGKVEEVVQGGGGKITLATLDTGDLSRKPKGRE